MAISKESIALIRERVDIVEEIGSRITLKKTGANHSGLCPFHGEKSPSFSVNQTKQFYHCFGCGVSGDVIEFLMKHDGVLFHEAVKDLGERHGIPVEEDQDEASLRRAQHVRQHLTTLEQICEQANGFFRRSLPLSENATQYALSRGLSPEIVEQYGIGYAPAGWNQLCTVFADYSNSTQIKSAGLVIDSDVNGEDRPRRSRIDRFRDRLIFPIRDVRGHCIGFGGRVINANSTSAPKYLNSPETPIFLKHKVLYGLHEARAAIAREKIAYVTEGYMDVVMMAQYGVGNAVAAMGTALSEDHVRLLLRFTDRVCFIFDGDKAGISAAWKSLRVVLPFLRPQHSISFLTLENGQDPDEYLKINGKTAFLEKAGTATALSEYLMGTLAHQYGKEGLLHTVESKTQFSVAAEDLVALITDDNPLKALLLQSIDIAVGRPARQTIPSAVKISAQDRLRMAAAKSYTALAAVNGTGESLHTAGGHQRPWLPRDEYLKTLAAQSGSARTGRKTYVTGSGLHATSSPLKHNKQSLWTQICNAVVIAPATGAQVAQLILCLLDDEAEEEKTTKIVLQECTSIPDKSDTYPADVVQGAVDLLHGATKLISRQRTQEVKDELKALFQSGAISDDEYSSQLLGLGR